MPGLPAAIFRSPLPPSMSSSSPPMRVAKFGGTSVGSPERIRAVARLVVAEREAHPDARLAVVSSAMGGVTDRLLAALRAAEARTGEHRAILDELRQRHAEALTELAGEGDREAIGEALDVVFGETEELLQGVALLREATPRAADAVASAGERLSVLLVAAALRAEGLGAVALDARAFVRTDDAFGEAAVDFEASHPLIREAFGAIPEGTVAVVTGFLGATEDGVTTTLGRSGSDYTATILGAALDAEEVVIWTDVDGVLSADPRIVPEAFTLPHLSYREAGELAHFGAKVLHPHTMRPLEKAGIPLRIKNTLAPEGEGTRILAEPPPADAPVRAVTAVREAALVTLEGAGLIGVPDLTARAFAALAVHEVPVLLIAQASSEGSLCFAVREADREGALRHLRRAFEWECERGDLRGIRADAGLAMIAAVGGGLHSAPGLAGRMFATLGRAHVNVRAIAEGASDHNLSCVVADRDAVRAVQALHEAFALRRLRAHVAVIGAGTLGRRLLALLAEQAATLAHEHHLYLRLVGVADSRRLVWEEDGLPLDQAADQLAEASASGADPLDALTERLDAARLERLILVDATGAEAAARRYPGWLRQGVGVVTPSQRANTLDLDFYDDVRLSAREGEAPFLYETSVGAGLAVLSTLRDLLRTGDTVRRVEGAVSGTLAFVFNAMRAGQPFSEAVRDAAARGLTEADPRADLGGEDVARKLLLLARELGRRTEPGDVQVQSLVPEALRDLPLDEFWARLPELDEFWTRKMAEFAARRQQLQYVAVLAEDQVRAGVQALPAGSPLADLLGAQMLFAFHTARYGDEPLVVRGPGANADITAAVLLADVAKAAEAMR
jgi:bifunctional aspartokinase / homoserine dehydrogenase 1